MQLDVFRGLAALLMVLNHSGFAWLDAMASVNGLSGAAVFSGGWAPCLFFVATGLGMGWQGQRIAFSADILKKAAWLLLADMLLNVGQGTAWGFNFFGFTALSMLAVAVVRSVAWSRSLAIATILALLLMRYGFTGFFKAHPEMLGLVMGFITGIAPPPGVSYPLSPWLVYPLLGWLLAQMRADGQGPQRVPRVIGTLTLVMALVMALAATVMVSRGMPLFRWGSMSLAYFCGSLAGLALCWLAAGLLVSQGSRRLGAVLSRWLALRGPASLLVVPLHYLGVAFGSALWGQHGLGAGVWLMLAPAFALAVIAVSRRLAAWLQSVPVAVHAVQARRMGHLSLVAALALWLLCELWLSGFALLLTAALGQVLIAWRLGFRTPRIASSGP